MHQLRQILDRIDVVVRRRRNQFDTGRRMADLRDPGIHFRPRQLTALTRFRALGHLDLQFLGLGQIVARYAKTPRSHLLDRAILGIAIGFEHVAGRIFATLAGIAAAAETVHRDGQTLVRLLADRAVGHRSAFEAPGDRLDRLDLFNRDRFRIAFKLQQAAQGRQTLRLIIDLIGILLIDLVAVFARRPLEQVNRLRVEEVLFAVLAPLIMATDVERLDLGRNRRECRLVAGQRLARDIFDTHTLDLGRGPGEVAVHHLLVESDGLENLRATITLDGRDTHLGHHLNDALDGAVDIALLGLFVGIAFEHILTDHVVDPLEGHIGIDRLGAITEQQAEVMHLARLTRFERQPDMGAGLQTHQMVMHPGHRHQRRYRHIVGIHAAV